MMDIEIKKIDLNYYLVIIGGNRIELTTKELGELFEEIGNVLGFID